MSNFENKDDNFIQNLADEIIRRIENKLQKKWLRSSDVRKMLSISDSVLQQLRINGDLPAVRTSTGTWLYPYDGIVEALDSRTKGGKGGKL